VEGTRVSDLSNLASPYREQLTDEYSSLSDYSIWSTLGHSVGQGSLGDQYVRAQVPRLEHGRRFDEWPGVGHGVSGKEASSVQVLSFDEPRSRGTIR